MRKIRELLRLHHSETTNIREIAAACWIAAATVHENVRRLEAAGLNWPLPPDMLDDELKFEFFAPVRQAAARPFPDWSLVQRELCRKG